MSCQTSHGYIVAAVYTSPAMSQNDIIKFLLHNFSAVCQEDVPMIVTGDFNVNVLRCENEWLMAFLTAKLGLHLLSDITQPTTRNNT